jgi:hypothetical protein
MARRGRWSAELRALTDQRGRRGEAHALVDHAASIVTDVTVQEPEGDLA